MRWLKENIGVIPLEIISGFFEIIADFLSTEIHNEAVGVAIGFLSLFLYLALIGFVNELIRVITKEEHLLTSILSVTITLFLIVFVTNVYYM